MKFLEPKNHTVQLEVLNQIYMDSSRMGINSSMKLQNAKNLFKVVSPHNAFEQIFIIRKRIAIELGVIGVRILKINETQLTP